MMYLVSYSGESWEEMKMKRNMLMGGKALALAALLVCGTAAFGTGMALADTAQTETTAGTEPAAPAVSGQITSCKITGRCV